MSRGIKREFGLSGGFGRLIPLYPPLGKGEFRVAVMPVVSPSLDESGTDLRKGDLPKPGGGNVIIGARLWHC